MEHVSCLIITNVYLVCLLIKSSWRNSYLNSCYCIVMCGANTFVFHARLSWGKKWLMMTQRKKVHTYTFMWAGRQAERKGIEVVHFFFFFPWPAREMWREKRRRWMAASRCHTPAKRTERRALSHRIRVSCSHTRPASEHPAAGEERRGGQVA